MSAPTMTIVTTEEEESAQDILTMTLGTTTTTMVVIQILDLGGDQSLSSIITMEIKEKASETSWLPLQHGTLT